MIDAKHWELIRPYIFIQLVGGGFYIPGQDWRTGQDGNRARDGRKKCRREKDGAA